jgi:hypothetical protein
MGSKGLLFYVGFIYIWNFFQVIQGNGYHMFPSCFVLTRAIKNALWKWILSESYENTSFYRRVSKLKEECQHLGLLSFPYFKPITLLGSGWDPCLLVWVLTAKKKKTVMNYLVGFRENAAIYCIKYLDERKFCTIDKGKKLINFS